MNIDFKECVVRHDGKQFILVKKDVVKTGENAGQSTSVTLGYYTNAEHLLSGLIKHGMSEDCISSVEQIRDMINAAVSYVEAILKTK